jgi:hypothetical protein
VPPHLDTIRYVADRLPHWRQMDLGSTTTRGSIPFRSRNDFLP